MLESPKRQGFTLLEVVAVLALIAVAMGFTLGVAGHRTPTSSTMKAGRMLEAEFRAARAVCAALESRGVLLLKREATDAGDIWTLESWCEEESASRTPRCMSAATLLADVSVTLEFDLPPVSTGFEDRAAWDQILELSRSAEAFVWIDPNGKPHHDGLIRIGDEENGDAVLFRFGREEGFWLEMHRGDSEH